MAKLQFVICCEGSSIDRETGSLSVFNILEGLKISSFPFVFPKLSVIAVFERETDDDPEPSGYSLRVTHGSSELIRAKMELFFGKATRHRQVLSLQGLPVLQPGVLRFEILKGKKTLGEHRVDISSIEPAKLTGAAESSGQLDDGNQFRRSRRQVEIDLPDKPSAKPRMRLVKKKRRATKH